MALDIRERRANALSVGRPYMRDKFPDSGKGPEWRPSVAHSYGGNRLSPVIITFSAGLGVVGVTGKAGNRPTGFSRTPSPQRRPPAAPLPKSESPRVSTRLTKAKPIPILPQTAVYRAGRTPVAMIRTARPQYALSIPFAATPTRGTRTALTWP